RRPSPVCLGGTQRGRGPREPADLVGPDGGGAADVSLEAVGPPPDGPALLGAPFVGMPPGPAGEACIHRLESLARALVGVCDDPLLARRERGPTAVGLAVSESRHGVMRHRPAELGMTVSLQPRGRAL